MQHDQENLEFLVRQYNWLRARGEGHDESLNILDEKLDEVFKPLVARMGSSAKGFSKSDPFIADRLGGLARVLDHSGADASQRNSLMINALSLSDELRELGKTVRDGLLPRLSYVLLVCGIGFIISVIYTTYVFPALLISLEDYREAGVNFSPILSLGSLGYPLIFLILLLATAAVYIMCSKSSFGLDSGKGFASPFHRLPGFSDVDRALKTHLHLRYLQLYSRSGFSIEEGVSLTERLARSDNESMKHAVHAAWSLDTFENELDHQQKRSSRDIEVSLQKTASLWINIFSVAVALTIAGMVIDFYQPLFSLAKIF